jgi:hypothetical protein
MDFGMAARFAAALAAFRLLLCCSNGVQHCRIRLDEPYLRNGNGELA